MAGQSANEKLRDLLVKHQISIQRLNASMQKRVLALLNETEAGLRALIERKGALLVGRNPAESVTLQRLKNIEKAIKELRVAAIAGAMDEVADRMRDLAVAEPAFTASAMSASAPVVLDLIIPSSALLKALVGKSPFQGRTMKQWADKIARDDLARILEQIKIAMVQGEPVTQMARRIVGSASLRGADGVTQVTRQNAAAIVRTASNFFSNQARLELMNANSDVLKEELYVATLDARTTPICQSLDGKRFPVGEGPRPPIHWNCRSTRVPVLSKEIPGDRPFKSATEKQLLGEFTDKKGLDSVSSRDDLPRGTKGQFDRFARARSRELTGTTPAATTYQEFLGRQSAAFQDEVLGKTKGALFRRGGLALDRFVNRSGNELTLRQLVLRERDAFKAAGLNPDDYL